MWERGTEKSRWIHGGLIATITEWYDVPFAVCATIRPEEFYKVVREMEKDNVFQP